MMRPGMYVPFGRVRPSGGVSRWTPDGTCVVLGIGADCGFGGTYSWVEAESFVDDAIEESAVSDVFYLEVRL